MSTLATPFTHSNNQPVNGTPTVREGATLATDCHKHLHPTPGGPRHDSAPSHPTTPAAAPSLTVGVPCAPHQPPSPKPDLLCDFLTGDVPLDVILADHNLTPDQFLAWIASPRPSSASTPSPGSTPREPRPSP